MTTVLERLYAAWNEHDIDGVLVQFASETHYRDQPLDLDFRTPGELGAYMIDTFVAMPDLNFEVTASFDSGLNFAGEAVMRGTFEKDLPGVPATGKTFEVHYAIVGTVDAEGKIVRVIDYWNAAEFLS